MCERTSIVHLEPGGLDLSPEMPEVSQPVGGRTITHCRPGVTMTLPGCIEARFCWWTRQAGHTCWYLLRVGGQRELLTAQAGLPKLGGGIVLQGQGPWDQDLGVKSFRSHSLFLSEITELWKHTEPWVSVQGDALGHCGLYLERKVSADSGRLLCALLQLQPELETPSHPLPVLTQL